MLLRVTIEKETNNKTKEDYIRKEKIYDGMEKVRKNRVK